MRALWLNLGCCRHGEGRAARTTATRSGTARTAHLLRDLELLRVDLRVHLDGVEDHLLGGLAVDGPLNLVRQLHAADRLEVGVVDAVP